jgi:CDP-diacylglycerol--glycerol-3-phosphate 3-phosphatidyltransferase
MSVPDALAYLRALAGLAVFIALLWGRHEVALGVFVVASLSDALDGWLARRSRIVTEHGALLDPLADKVLVLATLAALSVVGAVPVALAAAIAVRELLVSGLRVLRHRAGERLPASPTTKVKTALEMCGIALLIVARPPAALATVGVVLLAAALALGLVTLPTYFPHRRPRYTT